MTVSSAQGLGATEEPFNETHVIKSRHSVRHIGRDGNNASETKEALEMTTDLVVNVTVAGRPARVKILKKAERAFPRDAKNT